MIAVLLSSVSFLFAEPALAVSAAAPVVSDTNTAPAESASQKDADRAKAPAPVETRPGSALPNEAAADESEKSVRTDPAPGADDDASGAAALGLDADAATSGKVVFADLSDQAVADKALQYIEELKTLSGDFIQTAPSGAVTTGKFYLRRPGQARFDYNKPSPLTIVATQGLVYVENDELDTTDSYPLKKTPLRFLLNRKIEVKDARLAGVVRGDRSVAVTWASTDPDNAGDLTLEFAAPDLTLERWAVRDPQNGVTIIDLQDVKSGVKLANRLFAAPEAGGAFINK